MRSHADQIRADRDWLADALQDEIGSAACTAIEAWFEGLPPALTDPDDALLLDMMRVSLGDEIPAALAGSREIRRRLEQVADTFHVRRHIRFGVEVVEAPERYRRTRRPHPHGPHPQGCARPTLRAKSGQGFFAWPQTSPAGAS